MKLPRKTLALAAVVITASALVIDRLDYEKVPAYTFTGGMTSYTKTADGYLYEMVPDGLKKTIRVEVEYVCSELEERLGDVPRVELESPVHVGQYAHRMSGNLYKGHGCPELLE